MIKNPFVETINRYNKHFEKISVTIIETLLKNLEIETIDEEEVIEFISKKIKTSDIVLGDSDFVDCSICIEE